MAKFKVEKILLNEFLALHDIEFAWSGSFYNVTGYDQKLINGIDCADNNDMIGYYRINNVKNKITDGIEYINYWKKSGILVDKDGKRKNFDIKYINGGHVLSVDHYIKIGDEIKEGD
jgi:hypothetical protein